VLGEMVKEYQVKVNAHKMPTRSLYVDSRTKSGIVLVGQIMYQAMARVGRAEGGWVGSGERWWQFRCVTGVHWQSKKIGRPSDC
jgi:hypothetical protein